MAEQLFRKCVVGLDQPDLINRTQHQAMSDIEIAASPIRIDVEIVLQTLRIVSANDDHRLIRSIVARIRQRISGYELKAASEATLQLHRERVVTRIRGAFKQADPRESRYRTCDWMT